MMTIQLGRTLVHAFTNGSQGGNPSYVIATAGRSADLEQECVSAANTHACEVTHVHFDDASGQVRVRFYVKTGSIRFCGHGALAATAWAVVAGWADDKLLLDFGSGQLQMQVRGGNCFGFIEPAGDFGELKTDTTLCVRIAAMLGLEDLFANEGVRVWLGGRQRAKAMIALPSRATLSKLRILPDARDRFCETHHVTGIYPFVSEPDGHLAARHFPIHAGMDEDMATGNIASTVAALVCCGAMTPLTIAQGGPWCTASRLHLFPHIDSAWFVGGTCYIEGRQAMRLD